MIQLPVPSQNNTAIDVPIEGYTYTFYFTYNSRNHRLYLSILLDGVTLINGLRIVEDGALTDRYHLSNFANGNLYIFNSTSTNDNVTLGNLGIDHPYWLIYLPA